MKWSFDILVVGAGPAGIAAAVTAAEAGRHVGLVDDNPAPGGQIWRSGTRLPTVARQWQARLDASSVVRLQGWRVYACPERGLVLAERNAASRSRYTYAAVDENSDYAELHCGALILATGARERFLPFPGWTLQNVMGAGGLDAMVRGGVSVAGKRVVVAGTGPLLLAVAAHLAHRKAKVSVICEQASGSQLARFASRMLGEPAKLWQGAQYRMALRRTRYLTGTWPIAANGRDRVESVTLRRGDKRWSLDCDYLACGFHLVPNTELAELLGCRIENGFVGVDQMLQTSIPSIYCAGEPNGIGGVELALIEGHIAALSASGDTDTARSLARQRRRKLGFVRALEQSCALNPQLRELSAQDTIVCRCEDVRYGALHERTGWREAKLHTRCGMGPCQGRICGPATAFLFNWHVDSVRPPVFPSSIASLVSPRELAPGAEILVAANASPQNSLENSKETP
jgi:NADPH-dependent 2,4-dienoyl-CoA reductase/sulfur reductase-like enzyme